MKKAFLISLALVTMLSCASCSNKEETESNSNSDLANGNWAVNDVNSNNSQGGGLQEVHRNDSTTSAEDSTAETTTEPIEIPDIPDYQYNVKDDPNYESVTDFEHISIDGKMINVRSNYETLKKTFKLTQNMSSKYGSIELDVDEETKYTNLTLSANPTSGVGTINFNFIATTDGSCTVKDMKLQSIFLSGGDIDGKQSMTIGLPGNIKFGDSLVHIKEIVNEGNTRQEVSDDEKSWSFTGSTDSDLELFFSGVDGGLKNIKITCK